jgi:hypothetical protein
MLWATPPLFRQPQLRELRLRFDIVAGGGGGGFGPPPPPG